MDLLLPRVLPAASKEEDGWERQSSTATALEGRFWKTSCGGRGRLKKAQCSEAAAKEEAGRTAAQCSALLRLRVSIFPHAARASKTNERRLRRRSRRRRRVDKVARGGCRGQRRRCAGKSMRCAAAAAGAQRSFGTAF